MEILSFKKGNEIKGILLALLSASIFGIHPTLVYFLRSEGMGISATLFTSCTQGLTIYILVLIITNKLERLKVNKEQILKLILCSVLFYSTLWVLFYSYTKIPSGLATVIHFAYPSLVTAASVLTKRDRLTKALLIALISTLLGVLLVSGPSGSHLNPFGIFLAALSAVLFSAYIYMINDNCFKKLNNTAFVFYNTLIGAGILITAILIESTWIRSPSAVWGSYSHKVVLGALTLGITQGIGVFSFAKAIKYIGGPTVGALATFEPLTAVIIGILFFQETLRLNSLLGCLLILGATINLSISKLIAKEREPESDKTKNNMTILKKHKIEDLLNIR